MRCDEGRFTFAQDDGIVVGEVREDAVMEVADVAPALLGRLGPEATEALVDLFTVARQEWTAEVTTVAVERFDRRLSDEASALRGELRSVEVNLRLEIAGVRQELKSDIADLRLDMTTEFAKVREEMAAGHAKLHQEMNGEFTAVRRDIATLRQDNLTGRMDMLKWSIGLWLGQIVAVATIVGIMLRTMQN